MTSFARSADGTRIAYGVSGDASGDVRGGRHSLVLVHGTGDTRARWSAAVAELEGCYRLYAMDRRGHGESGDAPAYQLEREFEDVAALVAAATPPVTLIGHSFGAVCALEAAERYGGVAGLVLYEPPIQISDDPRRAAAFSDKVTALTDAGDLEGAWVAFLTDIVGVPAGEIDRLRASPSWAAHVATAPTLGREVRFGAAYGFDPQCYRDLDVPTLLLTASESPPPLRAAARRLRAAFPRWRFVELQGQGHSAMSTAPALFARTVIEFLEEASGSRTLPRASRPPRSSAARP